MTSPLRDATRVYPHSYSDEIPEPYQYEPYRFRFAHVAGFVYGTLLVYALAFAWLAGVFG